MNSYMVDALTTCACFVIYKLGYFIGKFDERNRK